MKLNFTDGVSIETSGALRVLHLQDGYYVVGEGNLIPVNDWPEAIQTIANMKVYTRGSKFCKVKDRLE